MFRTVVVDEGTETNESVKRPTIRSGDREYGIIKPLPIFTGVYAYCENEKILGP